LTLPAGQAEVAAFLAGLAGGAPIETHISAIFRGADTVWKLKKAVTLGFLDFSPIERRRHFLDRELALNAPFVPGLYRDVVAVTREPGGLALGGDGAVLDWVLRMAPVREDDFLDAVADSGRMDGAVLQALADAGSPGGRAACRPGRGMGGGFDGRARRRCAAAGGAGVLDPAGAWRPASGQLAAVARPAGAVRCAGVRRGPGDDRPGV
jgi:hypothetical protein